VIIRLGRRANTYADLKVLWADVQAYGAALIADTPVRIRFYSSCIGVLELMVSLTEGSAGTYPWGCEDSQRELPGSDRCVRAAAVGKLELGDWRPFLLWRSRGMGEF
jgi:hypothetical protein